MRNHKATYKKSARDKLTNAKEQMEGQETTTRTSKPMGGNAKLYKIASVLYERFCSRELDDRVYSERVSYMEVYYVYKLEVDKVVCYNPNVENKTGTVKDQCSNLIGKNEPGFNNKVVMKAASRVYYMEMF